MIERDVGKRLRERAKVQGGKAYKFVSPGNDGVPDRLVCLPGGRIAFVEIKAPGKKSTPLQCRRQRELRELGCMVFTDVDNLADIDRLLEIMSAGGQQ
jgi:hypothetical protein